MTTRYQPHGTIFAPGEIHEDTPIGVTGCPKVVHKAAKKKTKHHGKRKRR